MIERMTYRRHKKKCMIYPEDKFKSFWDLLMTLILLAACVATPVEIAFASDTDVSYQNPLSLAIDIFFLVDIMLIFNTAFYDDEMELTTSRKEIANDYLRGWFILDFLAVVPFDIFI